MFKVKILHGKREKRAKIFNHLDLFLNSPHSTKLKLNKSELSLMGSFNNTMLWKNALLDKNFCRARKNSGFFFFWIQQIHWKMQKEKIQLHDTTKHILQLQKTMSNHWLRQNNTPLQLYRILSRIFALTFSDKFQQYQKLEMKIPFSFQKPWQRIHISYLNPASGKTYTLQTILCFRSKLGSVTEKRTFIIRFIEKYRKLESSSRSLTVASNEELQLLVLFIYTLMTEGQMLSS